MMIYTNDIENINNVVEDDEENEEIIFEQTPVKINILALQMFVCALLVLLMILAQEFAPLLLENSYEKYESYMKESFLIEDGELKIIEQ